MKNTGKYLEYTKLSEKVGEEIVKNTTPLFSGKCTLLGKDAKELFNVDVPKELMNKTITINF